MKKPLLTSLFLWLTIICNAQTTTTKYYKDNTMKKEVSKSHAKYSKSIISNLNGCVQTIITNLENNHEIRNETYLGKEPTGIWNGGIDYNFDLVYSKKICADTLIYYLDYSKNNAKLKYIAPRISTGESSIYKFLSNNIIYPPAALRNGIKGQVLVTFTILTDGRIENIEVLKGAHVILDKEAVRVIRKLKFSSPVIINGQPQVFCMTLPVTFTFK